MASAKEHQLDISEEEQALILMRSLDAMRKEEQNCDLVIKVDDEDIHVHRAVISARSDYFKAMFFHDTAENRSGVVEMKGVGSKFVKKGIEHIYGGKASICEDDCEEFLIAATMMQLPFLCGKIEKFLALRLNPTKFFEFKRIAEKFSCKTLKGACYEYASENLGAISKEDEFEDLEMEYLLSLMQIENSPYSEDVKCSVLLQWIKYDVEDRKCHLITLMEGLNLQNITRQYNKYLTVNEAICYESAECLKSLYLAVMKEVKEVVAPAEISFSGRNNALVVFDKTSSALHAYHPETKTWTKMHDLHEDLPESTGYTAVVHEKYIYALMATKKFLRLNVMELDSTWEQLEDMLYEHGKYLRATELAGLIYVAGENTMERYSLAENQWAKVASDNQFLNQCALAAVGETIYAFGGWSQSSLSCASNIRSFSVATSTWSRYANLNWSARSPAAVTNKEDIYVVGGETKSIQYSHTPMGMRTGPSYSYFQKVGNFARYSSRTHGINNLTSKSPRSDFALCIVNEKLCSIDGGAIEICDLASEQCKNVSLPANMNIMAPATVALWLPMPK